MKKRVLFFSRCDLVHLYGQLNEHLISDFNIIHVAYSKDEETILKNIYGVKDVINFKELFIKQKANIKIDEVFFDNLDALFIKQTNGRFNLNASLQSDRTFKKLNYDTVLNITAVYYSVWKLIFSLHPIDFFIHEPTSLMMNHMASVLCKEQGGVYSTHIMVQGESKFNFMMVDDDNGYPTEMIDIYNTLTDKDIENDETKITSFVENFRSSYSVFFDIMGTGKPTIKLYLQLLKSSIRESLNKILAFGKWDSFNDNIEIFLNENGLSQKRLKNCIKYRKIKYAEYNPNLDFYFYPLHLEPEAVVLYWAEGKYTNQIKLIENIASQLPVNIFLYVKDHPHLYGYRDFLDYKRLLDIPNVKFLPAHIPGKKIIKDSLGVITLNGTAGLEALFLNKHVITFGSAFYRVSGRIKHISNIRELRGHIYSLKNVKYEDDLEFKKFVLAYLKSQKEGFTNFYGNLANNIKIDTFQNISNIAKGLTFYFNR